VASGNTLDLATAVFACARASLVLVGLNTRLAPAQWDYMLEHSRVRLALAGPAQLSVLPGALPLAQVLREVPARPWAYREQERPRRTRRTPSSTPPAPPAAQGVAGGAPLLGALRHELPADPVAGR
jgi:acyl-CoA synthetase (AMP-forming)/AMP-acid ligase II